MAATKLERWVVWAIASTVLLLWIFPVWATDCYWWDDGMYSMKKPQWRYHLTARSRTFILNKRHGGYLNRFDGDPKLLSYGTWEFRSRLDFAANALHTGVFLAIACGALYVIRKNRGAV